VRAAQLKLLSRRDQLLPRDLGEDAQFVGQRLHEAHSFRERQVTEGWMHAPCGEKPLKVVKKE
jgi:hypothetical protein